MDSDTFINKGLRNQMPNNYVVCSQVPFLMCTLEIPQNIAAQVLALNLLLFLLLSPSLKQSLSLKL